MAALASARREARALRRGHSWRRRRRRRRGSSAAGGGRGDRRSHGGHAGEDASDAAPASDKPLNPAQRRLFELRLKLNEARKANQRAAIDEKKRKEAPEDFEREQKKKAYEGKKARREEIMEIRGMDPKKRELTQTIEHAQDLYKRWDKKKSNSAKGGEVFSKHNLYNAYGAPPSVTVDMDEYERDKRSMGAAFYADADEYVHGVTGADVPQDKIDRMAAELEAQKQARKLFPTQDAQGRP